MSAGRTARHIIVSWRRYNGCRIVRCGVIISCQSAATFEIALIASEYDVCKQFYGKYRTFLSVA